MIGNSTLKRGNNSFSQYSLLLQHAAIRFRDTVVTLLISIPYTIKTLYFLVSSVSSSDEPTCTEENHIPSLFVVTHLHRRSNRLYLIICISGGEQRLSGSLC